MAEPVRYAEGLRDYLITQITPIMGPMNADLATKVAGGFVPFALVLGSIPDASAPRIALSWQNDQRTRAAEHQKLITVRFKIDALIPVAGNNNSSNFEAARQVSYDWVQSLLDDDSVMQNPYINAGGIGNVTGIAGECGDFNDIFPRIMADGKTIIHGWSVPYSCTFSLKTM